MTLILRVLNGRERLAVRYRRVAARHRGVALGQNVLIERGVVFRFSQSAAVPRRLVVGDRSFIDIGCLLDPYGGSITLGEHVYVGPYSTIYGHGSVTIESDTLIASHCRILSSNHDVSEPGINTRELADVAAPTRIGRNCWLGTGVTVLAGVSIGSNSVVGAGSVVTGDIPPDVIAFGAPARVHSTRSAKARSSRNAHEPEGMA